MILELLYEEVVALNSAAERSLAGGGAPVLAPPEALAELEGRLPVRGDLSVVTLREQRRLLRALDFLIDFLRTRMDGFVVEQHVGSEDAVNAFFDYGHVLSARSKLGRIGAEMEQLIEAMTGDHSVDASTIPFPD